MEYCGTNRYGWLSIHLTSSILFVNLWIEYRLIILIYFSDAICPIGMLGQLFHEASIRQKIFLAISCPRWCHYPLYEIFGWWQNNACDLAPVLAIFCSKVAYYALLIISLYRWKAAYDFVMNWMDYNWRSYFFLSIGIRMNWERKTRTI